MQQDYEHFDADVYLEQGYPELKPGAHYYEMNSWQLDQFHNFYSRANFELQSLDVLDFGVGPTLHSIISVAPFAKNIVLAEYNAENREVCQKWLANKPGIFFNFSYFFRFLFLLFSPFSQKQKKTAVKRPALLQASSEVGPSIKMGTNQVKIKWVS